MLYTPNRIYSGSRLSGHQMPVLVETPGAAPHAVVVWGGVLGNRSPIPIALLGAFFWLCRSLVLRDDAPTKPYE